MDKWLVDLGGESDKNAVRLGTRKTNHIPNEMRKEAHPDVLLEDLRKFKDTYPTMLIRSVSNTYNCVGMVFATRRAWVDPQYVHTFLTDDGYTQLGSKSELRLGDVVVYRDKTNEVAHVGIIIIRNDNVLKGEISFKVLSKWSARPECIHDIEDVPEAFGEPKEYWTDRKLYEWRV